MLCLAESVAKEQDEFRYNCVMIINEITTIAKSNDGFRRLAFTSSSPAAKPAIGSLARSFPAKESRVIDQDVAMEAAVALKKLVSSDNCLCSEHCKSVIKFAGVPLLMKLVISGDEKTHPHV
ncbi:hypothetical protein J1N35_016169 [Gossypium stocksii]|uniref:Uncharacterized protein n=1 Tax=Gossypium stocksii TaxID=47602 RepID=A0A9D3VYG8_9ROSI|nr:hypothetical protein J1N35_016169 [Gossypium stocksii]